MYCAAAVEKTAQRLRTSPTASEALLRDELVRRGYKFRFNEVLEGYIPDFYFYEVRRIVELDGKQFHDLARDARRDAHFRDRGVQTFRIRSHRVFSDLRRVLRSIELFVSGKTAPPRKKKKKVRKVRKNPSALSRIPRLNKDHLPKRKKIR